MKRGETLHPPPFALATHAVTRPSASWPLPCLLTRLPSCPCSAPRVATRERLAAGTSTELERLLVSRLVLAQMQRFFAVVLRRRGKGSW